MDEQKIIAELERQYNPDYDLILNAPRVTASDYMLLALIKDLRKRIEDLESTVEEMLNPW